MITHVSTRGSEWRRKRLDLYFRPSSSTSETGSNGSGGSFANIQVIIISQRRVIVNFKRISFETRRGVANVYSTNRSGWQSIQIGPNKDGASGRSGTVRAYLPHPPPFPALSRNNTYTIIRYRERWEVITQFPLSRPPTSFLSTLPEGGPDVTIIIIRYILFTRIWLRAIH